MDIWLLLAAGLTFLTAIIHTCLGEWLIFRHWRTDGRFTVEGEPQIPLRHQRIIWASWHVLTVFALALGMFILHFAGALSVSLKWVIVTAMLGGSMLVLIGTRGKHPGWIAMGIVAILVGVV